MFLFIKYNNETGLFDFYKSLSMSIILIIASFALEFIVFDFNNYIYYVLSNYLESFILYNYRNSSRFYKMLLNNCNSCLIFEFTKLSIFRINFTSITQIILIKLIPSVKLNKYYFISEAVIILLSKPSFLIINYVLLF